MLSDDSEPLLVTSEAQLIAEILHPPAAVRTAAVGAPNPGDADARAAGQAGPGDHLADDLMPGDEARPALGQFSFDDMKVGAADPAGTHMQKNVTWLGLGSGIDTIFFPERVSTR